MASLLNLSLLCLAASGPAFASPARLARAESTVTVTQTVEAPSPTSTAWNAGAVTEYPIHSSCNHTERAQIKRGLKEAIILAQHAKDHILRWGNSSELYQKYFGAAPSGEAIGWFDKIVNVDKAGILFRCDNPDGNCANEGWAGHWRGANATDETVICPLSYETRRPLVAMCGLGYTVANSETNIYWASDLVHRLFHVPKIGEGVVEHYADGYEGALELAKTKPEETVRNSETLQYFALEAYAFDIAVPGEGCLGKVDPKPRTSEAPATETPTPTATALQAPSATSDAPKECHTHSDGVVHCD
ncbi:zincin [Westerdykella ornata]|uniref:Zincin n=1 Tax=Westerdykella ornata TaxID=318751 RepID=A0A6A6JUL9_WESOR|nr:zincin [Westerdykella ornata]KAF2279793.1 zincin [Westerdykella ornata]